MFKESTPPREAVKGLSMRDVTTERTTFRQPMYGGVLNTDRKSPSPSPNSTPRDKLKVSPGSPQQEAQMKHICKLVAEVEAALEADKQLRSALRETISNPPSVRSSVLSSTDDGAALLGSPSPQFGSKDLSAGHQLTSPPSTATTRHGIDRVRELEAVVESLTQRLKAEELKVARLQQRAPEPNGHSSSKVGAVYDKKSIEKERELKEMASLLAAEKRANKGLLEQLQERDHEVDREKQVLQEAVMGLRAQLEQQQKKCKDLELERDIMVTHKDSLVNALKHERSLVNYAIARLQHHNLDAAHLTQMQQQFAVDTIGGTFVTSSYSVPPSLGAAESAANSKVEDRGQHITSEGSGTDRVGLSMPESIQTLAKGIEKQLAMREADDCS